MQFFDWLWGNSQVGWLKTALLSGLFGIVILGLTDGFTSPPVGANKFIFIGLGILPLMLIRGVYWSWRTANLREGLLRNDPRARAAVSALEWRRPKAAAALEAYMPRLDPDVLAAIMRRQSAMRAAAASSNAPATGVSVQNWIAQHFAARGVSDMSHARRIQARLYLPDKNLAGWLVSAGHLLGFFPQEANRNVHEQAPLMVSLVEIANVRLSVPSGLALDIPQGVYSEPNRGGDLYVSMTTRTAKVNFTVHFSPADDARKEHVRWFMNGLLARLAGIPRN
jgi:hypothetical protein